MKNRILKEKRKAVGLTQQEVAKKVGITDTGYMNYEHGRREPKIGTAIKIADALGVRDLRELWGTICPYGKFITGK